MLARRSFLLFLFLLSSFAQSIAQDRTFRPERLPSNLDYKQDVIMVKIKPGSSNALIKIQKTAHSQSCEQVFRNRSRSNARTRAPKHDLSRVYRIILKPGEDLTQKINALRLMDEVEYAEPYYLPKPLLVPNDPEAQGGASQDYLQVIKAYQAWNVERGDTTITIAVLDTGADFDHEDLSSNIQYNLDDPINGIDDDSDGYIDNYQGWDFADNDNDPMADLDSHGTNVAGLFATTNNGVGMAGVGFDCRFLPLKIFKTDDNSFEGGYEAILYAAEQGADVINLSWGAPGGYSEYEQDVINYVVEDLNSVVIAAAGNTDAELNFYPASYDNVLSVGATNINDEKTAFGTFSNFIDLVAPGEAVYTTTNSDNYRFAQGSSFSAPMVAGAAGLLKARFPELTATQIMEKLRVNADPIDDLPANAPYTEMLGKGRLNVHRALIDNSSPSLRVTNFEYDNGRGQYAFFGDTIEIRIDLINYLTSTQNASVILSSNSPYVTVLDSVFEVGNLQTLQTTNNYNVPFRFLISEDAPVNHLIKLRLGMEDGFYQDYQYLNIYTESEYVNLTNDLWTMTVASSGNLGFNMDVFFGGEGLSYDDNIISDQIGFIHSNRGSSVSDNILKNIVEEEREFDFSSTKNIRLTEGSFADLELKSEFRNESLNEVHVENKTFLWKDAPANDLMVFEYRLSNISGSTIPVLAGGMFFDLDLVDRITNRADYDAGNSMIFAFDQDNQVYVGLALIRGASPVPHAIDLGEFNGNSSDIGSVFEKSEKETMLGTANNQAGIAGAGNDIAIMLSGSEASVANGESVILAFALVAGNSLADLQSKLAEAKNRYNEVGENPSRLSFFQVCSMQPAIINPTQGTHYEFYDDKDLGNLLFTGEAMVTGPLTADTSFYVVNVDSVYRSEPYRVDVSIADPEVFFEMSSDTLFLDGEAEPVIEFSDLSNSAVSWDWDFGNGFTSNVRQPMVQFETSGTYTIRLDVINATGCSGFMVRELVVLERSAKPELSNLILCENESISLNPSNATNIRVYTDNGLENMVFSGSQFDSDPLTSDTLFYVTNTDGDYESLPTEVYVSIDELIADFEVFIDTLDVSNKDLLIVRNKSTGNVFNEWTLDGNFFGTSEDISVDLINDDMVIELFVTSENGCVKSRQITINASVSPTPTVSNYAICEPSPVILNPGNGSVFYFYSDAGLTNLVHKGSYYETGILSDNTSYFVTGADNYRESSAVEIQVIFNEHNTVFSADKIFINLSEENTVNFTDESPGAVAWLWDFGNGQTSAEQNPSANYQVSGFYEVSLTTTNADGCSSTESLELQAEEVLGVDEGLASSMKIYPNPANTHLSLQSAEIIQAVQIMDISGKTLMEFDGPVYEFDIRILDPGVYILTADFGNKLQSLRFIKK